MGGGSVRPNKTTTTMRKPHIHFRKASSTPHLNKSCFLCATLLPVQPHTRSPWNSHIFIILSGSPSVIPPNWLLLVLPRPHSLPPLHPSVTVMAASVAYLCQISGGSCIIHKVAAASFSRCATSSAHPLAAVADGRRGTYTGYNRIIRHRNGKFTIS